MESTIGERITYLRKSIKMTQEEFANSICMSRSNLSNIEKDRFTITDRVIAAICTRFNVDENWLRTGEGDMFRKITQDEELAGLFGELLREDAPEIAKIKKKLILELLKLDDQQFESAVSFAKRLFDDKDE